MMLIGTLVEALFMCILLLTALAFWRMMEEDWAAQRSMDWEYEQNMDEHERIKAERLAMRERYELLP